MSGMIWERVELKGYDKFLNIDEATAHWNAAGTRILKYSLEMYHEGLKEHKLISAPDLGILKNKVNMQANKWLDKWQIIDEKMIAKERAENNQEEAEKRNMEALTQLDEIQNLLLHTLDVDDTIDWESIKNKEQCPLQKPIRPKKGEYYKIPLKPDSTAYVPTFSIFEKLFASLKQKKVKEFELKYQAALKDWEHRKLQTETQNAEIDRMYLENCQQWERELAKYEEKKTEFIQAQQEHNAKIDKLKDNYLTKDANSILEYCEMVLNNSQYPPAFPKDFEIEYNPENAVLIVEYQLPSIGRFPTIREVKYIASKKEMKETQIPDSQLQKMYDEAIYKIALRTLHELFEADAAVAIQTISFNGWVTAINKATGKEETNCILSIQAQKEEFMQIDLSKVDPKTCFRSLKGVAGSKLSALSPIQPILQISRTDKRFVESYNVAGTLDGATNIAAMDWQDFEHLIRELFEKEFSVNGGEVKVTQASRDGGVDAIAFDPDPIRGGKIVIQAKRYTNVVGVSAVRDLYGTVVNEGATKGILVTTAVYGPDAYEFAKGKPLTLLNGSNLLHLLEKHGHHAKIDLKEAKRLLADIES